MYRQSNQQNLTEHGESHIGLTHILDLVFGGHSLKEVGEHRFQ
jgi:hypothetical protein